MGKVNNALAGSDGTDITLTNPATFISITNLDTTNSFSITVGGITITIPKSTTFSEYVERTSSIGVTNGDSCSYVGYTTGPIIPS